MASGFSSGATAAVAALALLTASLPRAADAADLIGVYPYDPGVCANDKVLDKIVSRFAHQVRHVPNLPLVDIVAFDRIRENRYEPVSEKWPIERLYCQAHVALTDNRSRDIWYLIETPLGFAGVGSNVEFCVQGFDRWYVYGSNCGILR
jgi:hypothetical protein